MPYQTAEVKTMREVDIWGSHIETPSYLVEQMFKAMKAGFSPIILICGRQRSGKSFIALWLTLLVYQVTKKEFKLDNVIFYDTEKAIESLEFKNRDVEWIDEPDDIDYLEWQSKTHKAIRSMVNTQAFKNNLYIIISPFAAQIDRSLRVHCDFIIRTTCRGQFKAWRYNKRYDADDMTKATNRLFLDSLEISIKAIPKDILAEYDIYSKNAKDKIRIKRLAAGRKKEIKTQEDTLNELIELCEKRAVKNGS